MDPEPEKPKPISSAHVLISKACPNNCVFCATATKRKARQFPSKAEVLRFIGSCAQSGAENLCFSGLGEPSLDPHFAEYVDFARREGIGHLCLFTNGYRLTPEMARDWRERGLSAVLLSMHGMEPGHDGSVQREGSFREAVRALEIYAAQKYEISVNTCLTRYNLSEIPALVAFLAGYPVTTHTLSFPEWSGNCLQYPEALIDYDDAARIAEDCVSVDDTVTLFDNVPYCQVRRPTRELRGVGPILYFDGQSPMEFQHGKEKLLPETCGRRRCPLIGQCPGFERNYISARGWGGLAARADRFLDGLARNQAVPRPTDAPSREASWSAGWSAEGRKAWRSSARPPPASPDPAGDSELNVVLKPTRQCNGDCAYCSSYRGETGGKIDLPILRRTVKALDNYAARVGKHRLSIIWHGGEPMLMGKGFFRDALSEFRAYPRLRVNHLIQTNLLLLDPEWIDLFGEAGINVGTSVDPFSNLRTFRNGEPQFESWLNKFCAACEAGLNIGIVFTVVREHLKRARDVYFFFRNLQSFSSRPVGVKVNPVYPSGKGAQQSLPVAVDFREYGRFLAELWELWQQDGQSLPLSPFREWVDATRASCDFSGTCHTRYLSVNEVGEVFHCGRFADSGRPLGTVFGRDLYATLTESRRRRALDDRARLLRSSHCRDCAHWPSCRGGCPYLAELYSGDPLQPSPFCESVRTFFGSISPAVGQELRPC
jgi:radical SAM protein with 4Fe4S-binding SPASM domain